MPLGFLRKRYSRPKTNAIATIATGTPRLPCDLMPRATQERHRDAGKPADRADEPDRARATVGRVELGQPDGVVGEVPAARPMKKTQTKERRKRIAG